MSRLRTYLELARISNLPTVWSNVLVGIVLGSASASVELVPVGLLFVAVSLLYVGGMILNDVCDAHFDSRQRPDRPIPSGRVSLGAAAWLATACLVLGILIAAVFSSTSGVFAAALTLLILIYNLAHKHLAAAAVLMGVCRGLIYPLAASAVDPTSLSSPTIWVFAFSIAITTSAFTLVARNENSPAATMPTLAKPLGVIPIFATLAVLGFVLPDRSLWAVIFGAVCVAWLIRAALRAASGQTKAAILAWIAGLCLIDAFFLTLLDHPIGTIVPAVCFALTLAGHRRIMGT